MNRLTAWILLLALWQCCSAQVQRCGASWLAEQTETSEHFLPQLEAQLHPHLTSTAKTTQASVVLPVVVHVLWHLPEENVSDDLIVSQIDALNRDFNGENEDLFLVPDEFRSLAGASGIRFCLASMTPDGQVTNGILRRRTAEPALGSSDALYFTDLGGSDAWDPAHYVNIWVAATGGLIAGFGSYPGQVPPERDGVVVDPAYFGVNGHDRYGEGRVAVHEMGHYLGLQHLWGNGGCSGDDGVADTPPQSRPYTACPPYPQSDCAPSEQFMNFMDYVYDPCMLLFTAGQRERMWASLEVLRTGFLDGTVTCNMPVAEDVPPDFHLSPNPVEPGEQVKLRFTAVQMRVREVRVFDARGALVGQQRALVAEDLELDVSGLGPGLYLVAVEGTVRSLWVR